MQDERQEPLRPRRPNSSPWRTWIRLASGGLAIAFLTLSFPASPSALGDDPRFGPVIKGGDETGGGDDSTRELTLGFSIQSIAPFTHIGQIAPSRLKLPRFTEVTFSVSSNFTVRSFVWTGAEARV